MLKSREELRDAMLGLLVDVAPVRDPEGRTLGHARWMLENLPAGTGTRARDRRCRWIGYAQALLVIRGRATLDELRSMTGDAERAPEGPR